jgi:hypothetical protein
MVVQIGLMLIIALQGFLFYKERQKLIDRIQAGSFVEYKKFEDKPQKKKEEEKKPQNEYANLI